MGSVVPAEVGSHQAGDERDGSERMMCVRSLRHHQHRDTRASENNGGQDRKKSRPDTDYGTCKQKRGTNEDERTGHIEGALETRRRWHRALEPTMHQIT